MFSYGHLQTRTNLTPEASLIVHNPSNNSQIYNVQAIVDTGAVMTCIPESEIRRLGRSIIYSTIHVRDANENIEERRTYCVDITIADYRYENLEVIAIDKQYALIGRDILNQHKVVLNAPIEIWGLDCTTELCPRINQNG